MAENLAEAGVVILVLCSLFYFGLFDNSRRMEMVVNDSYACPRWEFVEVGKE
jgi:hypothetical protein